MNRSAEQQVQQRCSQQVDQGNCVARHQETPDGHTAGDIVATTTKTTLHYVHVLISYKYSHFTIVVIKNCTTS